MRACDVARADVARLHHTLRTTPYQANRVLAMLSKMFAWADKRGVTINGNPARGIERYKEEKRKLFLRADDLAKIGAAMREMVIAGTLAPEEAGAIRLLLFTGCRLNEILTLRLEYVDTANAVLRLPDSKTGANHTLRTNLPRSATCSVECAGIGCTLGAATNQKQSLRHSFPTIQRSSPDQPGKAVVRSARKGWTSQCASARSASCVRLDGRRRGFRTPDHRRAARAHTGENDAAVRACPNGSLESRGRCNRITATRSAGQGTGAANNKCQKIKQHGRKTCRTAEFAS